MEKEIFSREKDCMKKTLQQFLYLVACYSMAQLRQKIMQSFVFSVN